MGRGLEKEREGGEKKPIVPVKNGGATLY